MTILVAAGLSLYCAAAQVVSWTFDTDAALKVWAPNGHLANVRVENGVLSADAVDWDPSFSCRDIAFAATPWQYVVVRIRADKPGGCELFWSGELTGQYGGLSGKKSTPFQVKGNGQWEDIPVFPFWQTEGTIRQLRLDVFADAHFDIESVQVLEWGGENEPAADTYAWTFENGTQAWQVGPDPRVLFAPRLRLSVETKDWVTVRLRSDADATASLLWCAQDGRGMQTQDFAIRGGAVRAYNVEVAGIPDWHEPLVAFGIRLPRDANVQLDAITIAEAPSGPPEISLSYFGFENGVNRAGRAASLLAVIENRGGTKSGAIALRLSIGNGLRESSGQLEKRIDALDYDDQTEIRWDVAAEKPGTYSARVMAEGEGAPEPAETALTFLSALDSPQANYVPEPQPIETSRDVCAYYFPGWNAAAKWDCIRRVAPVRKPLLGYYDEGNVECVDWQIKWAAENGIACLLVDWYWVAGQKQLEHWFDAYRDARYRKYLKVAIMWANHNPPGTHSIEDWRAVTREWLDRYFTLDTYYALDGKPAVFLWSPQNIRDDLGGSAAVADALGQSQEMARAAGYPGITFVAMFGHESESGVKSLLEEGYWGATSYHEWGRAQHMAKDPNRADFENVVLSAPDAWKAEALRCGELAYFPIADTGWDSRPWHGDKSLVIAGRTPERFERLMRAADACCDETGRNMVVLGPLNEWGEGSYIEPNTEFGFDNYERIRAVFGKGDPAAWPVNVSPADVGRGPYDFPGGPALSAWTFDKDAGGWCGMMGVSKLECREGALQFATTTDDPALIVYTYHLPAEQHGRLVIRMQSIGKLAEQDQAQLFFCVGGRPTSEPASYRFPLATDGQMHTYTIDLKANPRWRSRISALRFDPCGARGVQVRIDQFALE